jgi:hypothetical protein
MIKNKKVFRINESEKAEILEMHKEATKRQYMTEQFATVQGKLMDAVDGGMMGSYMKMFKDPKQIFVVMDIDGDVKLPNSKFLKPTDVISLNGRDSRVVVHPEGDVDTQVMIQPRDGKIMLFLGA